MNRKMPPKEPVKKSLAPIPRPPISDSSLIFLPDDVLEGFQERLETGIDWSLEALARRYHRSKCLREHIPTVPFSEGLQNRIQKSILSGFLDENSPISLQDQWEILLPLTQWDVSKSNEEGKVCFRSVNCITDNVEKLIERAVKAVDRALLMKDLKEVPMLRILDSKITDLDSSLSEFTKLVTLNLCGNYIGDIDTTFLPRGLKLLELQANRISRTETFAEHLPPTLLYLGLAKNLLTNESLQGLPRLPRIITTLDLSDNDICNLQTVLNGLGSLPYLTALSLAGNPCSVCLGYSSIIALRLPKLQWLDSREILPTDRPDGDFWEPHPDDYRSNYFNFTVLRIMSIPQPPKPDKGVTTTFHVELELPLLDSKRRNFLMFRRNESLREMLPQPEGDSEVISAVKTRLSSIAVPSIAEIGVETSSHESNIYARLVPKESREILNYTVFESNKLQWNKMMNFQEPTVRIFCPDLVALRDTFQTVVTIRLVYTLVIGKPAKPEKGHKSTSTIHKLPPGESRVVLATIRCALKNPDWSQRSQHFHWDDTLGTNDAIHWGDGDLSILQYSNTPVKSVKGKPESDLSKLTIPDNLTCQFSFGIDAIRF
ncbi:uncharacterized protein LOC134663574 [Cydia fagiglandana]|uniref:uncharacterized protein LOC134663574 n=1 Tax=Cydia fagiglandana TaxID=1458189 RepID=UPI002FEE341E